MNNHNECCDTDGGHQNDMDNPAHLNGSRSSAVDLSATELEEVKMSLPSTATTSRNNGGGTCHNGPCKPSLILHNKPESPWHSLKTVFLASFIIALIVWIIVYTLLTQNGITKWKQPLI